MREAAPCAGAASGGGYERALSLLSGTPMIGLSLKVSSVLALRRLIPKKPEFAGNSSHERPIRPLDEG
jgi:hypothetical protein